MSDWARDFRDWMRDRVMAGDIDRHLHEYGSLALDAFAFG